MIRYYVLPQQRKVICIITDKYSGKTFKGVAVCALEDTFNEELGKQIALDKACLKEVTYAEKVLNKELEDTYTVYKRKEVQYDKILNRKTFLAMKCLGYNY